jgi:uncharacterized protein (DUF2236 family)
MDAGLFGPDSVAWRLHADPSMLVGAMRALLVQALEPRARPESSSTAITKPTRGAG